MKTHFKKLFIIATTFLFILNIAIISNAENDITTGILQNIEEYGIPISQEDAQILSAPNNISGKNYYALSKTDLNIDTNVYGDVFVCANGTVTINSTISGNVFVVAREVKISETSEISASLFCVTQNLEISGIIKGNCYIVSQETNLGKNGYINLDLYAVADTLNIYGDINRDVSISVNKIIMKEGSHINGDLYYSSENESEISENSVGGNINFSKKVTNEDNRVKSTAKNALTSIAIISIIKKCLTHAIFALALFFILKYIGSNIITEHSNFNANLGKYILFGFLVTFVSPILLLILLGIGLTSKVAFLLILAYIAFMLISSSSFIIVLANMLAEKYKEKLNLSENLKMVLLISILSIVYSLLGLIPVLGGLLKFAIIILGVGITVCSLPVKKLNTNIEEK